MQPAVVIPVYNHAGHVADVARRSLGLGLPVIVVDDGSSDAPAEVLGGLEGIITLQHEENQGKGAALLTGFATAWEIGCDWALSIDADGQHNPEDAVRLLEAAKGGERMIVVGRRDGMESDRVPWTSRFGRGFSNFWVWASGGPPIGDSQSGFRLYPLPETMDLEVRARRYQFEVEVLVRARQQGIRIVETPVGVVYQPRGERVSHFRPWLDFWRNSTTFNRLIWARVFRRLRP
jgi:glycosyltransferase involved in cell wall biosynthesis